MIKNKIPRIRKREKRDVVVPKKPNREQEHHRKPSSLGGTNQPRNISLVFSEDHADWHTLYGNLEASFILEKLKEDILSFVFNFELDLCLTECLIKPKEGNFSPNYAKRKKAWGRLFQGKSLPMIIDAINETWLDPDYIFLLRSTKSRAKTIMISKIAA